jgi:hypothetical protein
MDQIRISRLHPQPGRKQNKLVDVSQPLSERIPGRHQAAYNRRRMNDLHPVPLLLDPLAKKLRIAEHALLSIQLIIRN